MHADHAGQNSGKQKPEGRVTQISGSDLSMADFFHGAKPLFLLLQCRVPPVQPRVDYDGFPFDRSTWVVRSATGQLTVLKRMELKRSTIYLRNERGRGENDKPKTRGEERREAQKMTAKATYETKFCQGSA